MKISLRYLALPALMLLAAFAAFAATGVDGFAHALGLDWGAVGAAGLMLAEAPAAITAKTIGERIAEFTAKRKELADKKAELVNKAVVTEGRTLDEHETEQNATLEADIKAIDSTLAVLKAHEATMVAQAATVLPTAGQGQGAVVIPGSGPITVTRNLPKGIAFTRYAMAIALAKGNLMQAEKIAEKRFGSTPEVLTVIKTAVAEGTTQTSGWASQLVQYQDMVGEFIEFLRPRTIVGRLDGVRRVPFNIRVPRQTAGATGAFVGEGSPTPVNKLTVDNVTHPWAKAACIIVVSDELAKLSSPDAEALSRDDLAGALAQYLDKRLVDPAYPGVSNVSPASLTNGVTARQATGATLASVDADVRYIMTQFADNELSLLQGVWIMSASTAIRLSMMRTNQDNKAFPELTVKGGMFYGLPVLVSNNVTGSGSPGDQFLILVDQEQLMLSEGDLEIDASTEASLEMNDAPSGGATSLRSLWQNNLLGLKAVRYIYWSKRRSQAVQFIDKAQSYAS